MRRLSIDIVSDVVCPWCLIGVRRMEQALAFFPDVEPDITFRPFQLDPSTPREGVDLRERLERKYGVPADAMLARVESAARESGIPLDFSKVTRGVNTLAAHTLLRHAIGKGTQVALEKALLDAYFLEGRDVGDTAVLGAIAAAHAFTEDEVVSLLGDEAELARTRAQASVIASQGVTGVPFFILDERFAFSGAQAVPTMRAVIEKALAEPSAGGRTRGPRG